MVPALLPQFVEAWGLTSAAAGWFAGIMFAGYMVAVIPLVGLTDVLPARRVYLSSSLLSAVCCFGVALSDNLIPALVFRALSGIALAGMYMPGLRALTEGIDGARRSRIAALYTSSFTVGASVSFLLGQAGLFWGWRAAFVVAGGLSTAGLLLGWTTLPRQRQASSKAGPIFHFRSALGNRDALMLMVGYAAAIWGSAGLRQWIVMFLVFCAASSGNPATPPWSILAVATLIGALGVPAGLLGNEMSIRFGLRPTAMFIFFLSALLTGLFGFAAMLPFTEVAALSLVAGFVVQGNFSNLTSGLLAAVSRQDMGATMALYSAIGFGGGFLGTLAFGIALDLAGGRIQLAGWVFAFTTCGLACLMGGIATTFLSRDVGHRRWLSGISR